MIREGVYDDDGEDFVFNEAALLCDWDLCKYKEQMGKGPRPPVLFVRASHSFFPCYASSYECFFQGTLHFRSAISLVCPMKPYQLSDDVESFIHVVYHLIARFARTSISANIGVWVSSFFETAKCVEDVDGRRVQIGGVITLEFMRKGVPLLMLMRNQTLESLTEELASLSAEHYRTLNIPDLRTRYAPVIPGPPQATNNASTGAPTLRSVWERKRKREEADSQPSRLVLKSVQSSPKGPTSISAAEGPGKSSSDGPVAKLSTHDALLELFYKYGQDVDGNFFKWPDEDLVKTEDQFLAAHLVPGKNNAFSLSAISGSFPSTAEQQPVPKRHKGMDESASA